MRAGELHPSKVAFSSPPLPPCFALMSLGDLKNTGGRAEVWKLKY